MTLAPAALSRRREARATCDSLLADLRRPCAGPGTSDRTAMQAEADTLTRLADAYDVVAETSSAPNYERGEAASHRARAAALLAQVDAAPTFSARPW